MSIDILHTADTHIGYRQYHKPEREEDFREALETIVDAAIEKEVDVVVHAGDIFDRSRPSISALSDLVDQLKRLDAAGIDFCTIVGNHDGTRDREWPEFLESLGLAVYLGYDGYEIGDVVLYGQDHVDQGKRDQLDYQFQESDAQTAFLIAHGLFTPFPHGYWDVEEIMAKSPVKLDGFLLGDDHTPQIEHIGERNIPATYPGSTERTAADQEEKRGYNLVRVVDGEVDILHETIETRTFDYIDIDMGVGDGVERVIKEVEDKVIEDGSVVVVTLTGEGNRVPPADVERVGLRKGALVVRVNDRREFEDEEREYETPSFEDPNEAVKQRKKELPLSSVGDELEQMARDLGGIPQSNLKDAAEERVGDLIDERGNDAFTDLTVGSDGTSSPDLGESSQSGGGERSVVGNEGSGNESLSDGESGQMNLTDIGGDSE